MSERKNLDQLFQEKINNFEVAPPKNAWQNIEIKLNEKQKKRRITPFWWKFSSVAAAIVLLVVLFKNYDIQIIKKGTNNVITYEKNQNNENTIVLKNKNNLNSEKTQKQNTIANTDAILNKSETNKTELETKNNSGIIIANQQNSNFEKTVATANTISKKAKQFPNTDETKLKNDNLKGSKLSETKTHNDDYETNNNLVLNKNNSSTKKQIQNLKNKKSIAFLNNKRLKNSVKLSDKKNKNKFIKTNFIATKSEIAENENINLNKNNLFENQLKQGKTKLNLETTKIKKIDSTKIAMVELNTLEKLQDEKDEKELKKKEPKLNRWQVTTNVAPIYFSSASNDSPLDAKFNSNQKEFNSNKSAGLGVNYALNKRIKLRTGINVLTMSYSTKDVVFYEASKNDVLNNLNPNAIGSRMQIENLNPSQPKAFIGRSSEFQVPSQQNINGASLNQKIGYIEIPLEMSYKVLDKKFSVDFIGGLSTFYLSQNSVSLKTNTLEMEIGEAKNLNKFHYSGNLGIGFRYNFLKHFDASVEPIYKYQINTFTNNDLNFKPNSFGIYSGINYTF